LPYAVRSSPPLCSEDTTTGGPDTESNLQHQPAPITSRRSTAVRPTEARVAPELGVGRSRHAIRHESGRVAVPQPAANTRPHVQQPGRPATTAAVVRRSRSAQGPVAARQQDRAGRQTASSAGRVWPDGLMRRQLKPPPGHPPRAIRAPKRAPTMRWSAAAGSSAWRLDRTAISGARQPSFSLAACPNMTTA
jgi:hypothetical protein